MDQFGGGHVTPCPFKDQFKKSKQNVNQNLTMEYFITSAAGFIGGRVVRWLVEAGHQVVALARTPAKATNLLKLGVALHEGDILMKESMRRPMSGVDGVFHLAGWYKIGAGDKSVAEKINVDATRNVLGLLRKLFRCRKFTHPKLCACPPV
jgi:nucleoside-diphosphate-sugar epimerase